MQEGQTKRSVTYLIPREKKNPCQSIFTTFLKKYGSVYTSTSGVVRRIMEVNMSGVIYFLDFTRPCTTVDIQPVFFLFFFLLS